MKYFEENNNTLVAHFEFKNFKQALDFVNRVGEIAENLNHHPNINMYEYKFVQVATTTHDSGNTITAKDISLAEKIELSYTI